MDSHNVAMGNVLYGKGTTTRDALELLADRWTILIVRVLEEGPARFTELKRELNVSGQVLTRALRNLERHGIVGRTVFAEVPPRVEYTLTEFGGTLCPVILLVRQWAEEWAGTVQQSRQSYDAARRNGDDAAHEIGTKHESASEGSGPA